MLRESQHPQSLQHRCAEPCRAPPEPVTACASSECLGQDSKLMSVGLLPKQPDPNLNTRKDQTYPNQEILVVLFKMPRS